MTEELPRVERVEAQPGYRLVVTWKSGLKMVVDLSENIRRGGVFEPLSDEKLFQRVFVAEGGRIIEWLYPTDRDGKPIIDMDAESLFFVAQQQRTAEHHRRR